jgi:hypothetical protein
MSAGKGDARRPTNDKVYGENYDLIFRKMVKEVCKLDKNCDCSEEHDSDHDSHDETTYL